MASRDEASKSAAAGTVLEITIVGERRTWRVLPAAGVDPGGARMRS